MIRAYYNEIDPYAAQWLNNLITAGVIPYGDVDTRSIEDVHPNDLKGYTQCHFFAGIAGWSLALKLAGWPEDRPVWTGSCPCQPFSPAGKGKGVSDERHLWPAWYHLIKERRPPVIFGEQVEKAIAYGWLDLVQDDLEGDDYAFAAVGIPAAGVGAPCIRHRLWWVACRASKGSFPFALGCLHSGEESAGPRHAKPQRYRAAGHPTMLGLFWCGANWLDCRDGKARPAEPGTFPLAPRLPTHVGRLRAYGNAIVPQVGAEVIRSFLDAEEAVK